MVKLLQTGPEDGPRLLLAHGAGAPMDSSYMEILAGDLAALGIRVIRFEFAYMAARREGPKRPPPPRMPKILDEYRAAIASLPEGPLAIGGKSMGGRAASLIADEMLDKGLAQKLVLFGYPFHPPTKPDHLRTEHLQALRCKAFLAQGERDPFGTKAEVKGYKLARSIRTLWLADGDHDFKPRVASGHNWKANMRLAAEAAAAFIRA